MLELSVPAQVSRISTVTVYGSLDVPTAWIGESGVGDTVSGGELDFDILIGTPGQDMTTSSFWDDSTVLPAYLDDLGDFTTYTGSTTIETGAPSTSRSLYLRYRNFQALVTGGRSTSIYNVTMSGVPPRKLSVAKQTKRGRFV